MKLFQNKIEQTFSNMRKIYFVLGLVLSCAVAGSSCTPLEDLHSNPNATTNVKPESLLAPILYDIADMGSRIFYDFTSEVMQYTVDPTTTKGVSRYYIDSKFGEAYFYKAYKTLNNIYEMNRLAKKIEDNNSQAVALTLQAFVYSNLADVFSAVPFSEACKFNEGIVHPKYENQIEVYKGCINLLDTAYNKYITTSTSTIAGMDIIYDVPELINGVEKTKGRKGLIWRRLTNSLRLRLLMRLVDDPEYGATARARIQSMVTASNSNADLFGFLSGNDMSAMVRYNTLVLNPSDRMANVKNPLSFGKNAIPDSVFTKSRAITSSLLAKLKLTKDVRQKVWFKATTDTFYTGIETAFNPQNVGQYNLYSGFSNELSHGAQTGILMTAAEVQFTLAEAYLKGYATGSPNRNEAGSSYNNGVNWAIGMWIDGTSVKRYSEAWPQDNENAKWDIYLTNAQLFERIMFQKYLSLFFTDVQAWVEYRRTGLPSIVTPNALYCANGNNALPTRLLYPQVEYNNNLQTITEAIARLGGDDIYKKGDVDKLWNNNNFYAR